MPAEMSADRLAELVTETLEEAAFVFCEPADPPPPFEGDVLEARLQFSGPSRGELALRASSEFAVGLAANLLGTERGDPEIGARSRDALGEIVNMLAGAVVLELFGPAAQTSIGVPAVKGGATEPPPPECLAHLSTEEGDRLDVWLRPALGRSP
ncbi:MAG TPA: chemotaxis protein CheX [Anaeromyxobacteraceae bacterium]|nr:chemotaxis protein CheX [Anaeromyxobacteraceae bacterium]